MRDPTADEMREFLAAQFQPDTAGGLDFDTEEAIYWFASGWHGGQRSNLYSALSTSEFKPGMAANGPEPDSVAAEMLTALEAEFTHE